MNTALFSWIGINDHSAWKRNRESGDGALLSIAMKLKAHTIELLWDDSAKVPLHDSEPYCQWLEGELRKAGAKSHIRVHPIKNSSDHVMEFAWVFEQADNLLKQYQPFDGRICINASSGTWIMSAVWVVLKKSLGEEIEIFISSKEKGVQPLDLPPALTIQFAELFNPTPSPLTERFLRGELGFDKIAFADLVVTSPSLKVVFAQAQSVAPYGLPVLLVGPPGVGKTKLAQAIHLVRHKTLSRFLQIDCGTLISDSDIYGVFGWEKGSFTGADRQHKGHIWKAENGTVFFDEIGNAPPVLQMNLLRLIQEGKFVPKGGAEQKVVTRVIAATNMDLKAAIRDGKFRSDLYDRLAGIVIHIPALCERKEEIMVLAKLKLRQFIEHHADQLNADGSKLKRFGQGVESLFRRYDWPGNIRELEQLVARLVIFGDRSSEEISAEDVRRELFSQKATTDDPILGRKLGGHFKLKGILDDVAHHYLMRAMDEADGNQMKMSQLLGMERTPLRTLIRRLKIPMRHGADG